MCSQGCNLLAGIINVNTLLLQLILISNMLYVLLGDNMVVPMVEMEIQAMILSITMRDKQTKHCR